MRDFFDGFDIDDLVVFAMIFGAVAVFWIADAEIKHEKKQSQAKYVVVK